MALKDIMAKVGGFRGLAAGAAIAWGTAQATSIAEQAQATAVAAQEALANCIAEIDERRQELESLDNQRADLIDSMRVEARLDVAGDIIEGKWDNPVTARWRQLRIIRNSEYGKSGHAPDGGNLPEVSADDESHISVENIDV